MAFAMQAAGTMSAAGVASVQCSALDRANATRLSPGPAVTAPRLLTAPARTRQVGRPSVQAQAKQGLGKELKQDMMGGHRDSETIGIPTEEKLNKVLDEGTDSSVKSRGQKGVVKDLASESAVEDPKELLEDARKGAKGLFGGDLSAGHQGAGRASRHLEQEAKYMSGESAYEAGTKNPTNRNDNGDLAKEIGSTLVDSVTTAVESLGEDLKSGGKGLVKDLTGDRRGGGDLPMNTEGEVVEELKKDGRIK